MFDTTKAMVGSYDGRLVALSVLIAIFASYAALELAARTTAALGRVRLGWLSGGAVAMGLGIWSMHYIGMLAFTLPVPVLYDWPTVLLSLIAAVFASGVALFVVSRKKMGWLAAVAGGSIMGGGIATMHYTGMAAMRLPAKCSYDPWLLTLSVVLAIVISLVALWLTFRLREGTASFWWKAGTAIIMGAAIPVMHYTGMTAAHFTRSSILPDTRHAVTTSTLGIAGVSAVTVLALGVAILTSAFDRRWQAEKALREQKNWLHTTLTSIGDAVIVTDADGAITLMNPVAKKLTGWTFEDAQGTPLVDVFHIVNEQTRQTVENPVDKVRRLNSVVGLANHTILIRKSGEEIAIDDSGAPIFDSQGSIAGVVLVFRDVTEQRRAQKAASQLAAIVEFSGDAIITKNLDGILQTWNAGAERLFGYKANEIIGKSVKVLIPADRLKEEDEILQRIRQGQAYERLETIRVAKDGTPIRVSVGVSPIKDAEGRVIGASKVIHDIRELAAAREELLREKELKRAEESLREISGQLLHLQDEERRRIARELHDSAGQTLAALSMNLMPLQDQDGLPARAAKAIKESLNLVTGLSRELRTISHLLHPPLLDEVGLASALRSFLEGFEERSKIKVTLEISDDFGRLPRDVETAIFRIVQEALTNVHRHSGSPVAKVRLARRDGQVLVEVADQGKGITAEKQKAMDSGAKLGVGMRGMGERVRQLGGTLGITSSSQGTIVIISLPAGASASITTA